jgi:hypothetical protein
MCLPSGHDPLDGDLILADAPFMKLSVFNSDKPPILVRAEYIRIYDELQKYCAEIKGYGAAAAVITGQPGIGMDPLYRIVFTMYPSFTGKSLSISYAIYHQLASRRQTMLLLGKTWYRFTELGVFEDQNGDNGEEPTWCFIDSLYAPDGLPVDMIDDSRHGLFPIYVTSLDASRWSHIEKGRRKYTVLTMNPWTWEEIKCA